jgi:hypothetical protein
VEPGGCYIRAAPLGAESWQWGDATRRLATRLAILASVACPLPVSEPSVGVAWRRPDIFELVNSPRAMLLFVLVLLPQMEIIALFVVLSVFPWFMREDPVGLALEPAEGLFAPSKVSIKWEASRDSVSMCRLTCRSSSRPCGPAQCECSPESPHGAVVWSAGCPVF